MVCECVGGWGVLWMARRRRKKRVDIVWWAGRCVEERGKAAGVDDSERRGLEPPGGCLGCLLLSVLLGLSPSLTFSFLTLLVINMVIRTRVTELLGIEYPILMGGMTGVGTPALAAAVSNAMPVGGLGIFAAHN
mgnify:CR=1 FL=1